MSINVYRLTNLGKEKLPMLLASTFSHAGEFSKKYTADIGSRLLDIPHVALTLSLNADRFLTFDDKQTRLADLAGLQIEIFCKTPSREFGIYR